MSNDSDQCQHSAGDSFENARAVYESILKKLDHASADLDIDNASASDSYTDEAKAIERGEYVSKDDGLAKADELVDLGAKKSYYATRDHYTKVIFWITASWLLFVFGIVFLTGVNVPEGPVSTSLVGYLEKCRMLFAVILGMGVWLVIRFVIRKKPAGENSVEKSSEDDIVSQGVLSVYVDIAFGFVVPTILFYGILFGISWDYNNNGSAALPSLLDWIAAFKISESTMLVLIGSTTANVLAVFVIVAKFLFPREEKSKLYLHNKTDRESTIEANLPL